MRLTLFVTAAFAVAAPAFAAEVVPVQEFRSVELRGGGAVAVVPGPAERVTIVEGSSQFTHMRVERDGQLRIDTCDERCPPNYRLRVEIRRHNPVGDTLFLGGRVTRKWAEDERHLVELALHAENQDGELSARGTAVVELPSRDGVSSRG